MPIDLSKVPGCIVSGDVLTINCIPYLVQNIIFWLLVFAGTVAVILIIVAGIKFILSGGDAKQTEGARKTLTFAIIGLILILFSFAIVKFIAQTTGLNCITRFGFSHCNETAAQARQRSCESSGGICLKDRCKVPGTGIAIPAGGWDDCSSSERCCTIEENQ